MESHIPENSNHERVRISTTARRGKVLRRYKREWENYEECKGWLQASPSSVYRAMCIVCNKEMAAELTSAKRHACGAGHLAAIARSKNLDSLHSTDVSDCSERLKTCISEEHNYKEIIKKITLNKRRKLRHYRPEWEEFKEYKDWLRACPSSVYKAICLLCNMEVMSDLTSIKRHAKGNRHMTNLKSRHQFARYESVAYDCSESEAASVVIPKISKDISCNEDCELLMEVKPELVDETQSMVSKVHWTDASINTFIEQMKTHPELWDPGRIIVMESDKKIFFEIASVLMEKHPQLGDLTTEIVAEKFGKLKTSYERERKKVKKSGKASTWLWYEPISILLNCSGSNASVLDLDCPVSHRDMLNCVAVVTNTDKGILQSKKPSSPLVPENLPVSIGIGTSSSRDRIPFKHAVVTSEKNVGNINMLAFEHLQKTLEQEKDFAYGIGVAVENHLRTLSSENQVKMASKIMALLSTNISKS